jgi:hypothetical protein
MAEHPVKRLYVSTEVLRQAYGVAIADIRIRDRAPLETWALPEAAASRLQSLFIAEGFDLSTPILVQQPTEAAGFFFIQDVEGRAPRR